MELIDKKRAYEFLDRATLSPTSRMIAKLAIDSVPVVRRRKSCSYCEGRSYSKKPLTVITPTMKRVEVVFEYCPACGRKMDLRTPTEVQLDEADSVMRGADND